MPNGVPITSSTGYLTRNHWHQKRQQLITTAGASSLNLLYADPVWIGRIWYQLSQI